MIELYRLFAQMADPRKARGIRHHLATVLTVMVFAVLAGARNYREIGDRAADLPEVLLVPAGARVDPRGGMVRAPSGSTIRRVAESIDAQAADLLVCRWLGERAASLAISSRSQAGRDPDGLFGVALDGKTVRNSGAGRPEANVRLFSAMLHDEAIVIAQLRVPGATTEITQVKALLDPVDLTGAVVTGDAAHTQHATAQYILDREADYVLTVKGNQCATRRSVVSPLQAEETRREVSGSDGLPGTERRMGTRACQLTGGQAQAFGMVRRGTRVSWRRLDCLNPNLQRTQFTSIGTTPETDARLVLTVLVRPGHPSRRGAMPSEGIEGDEWGAYHTLHRTTETNVGSPKGREPYGDGVPVVVAGVTTCQGGRESRPQGQGAQEIGHR